MTAKGNQLLAEDVLEAMLAETAETISVPANGARDVIAAARHAQRERPVRRSHAPGWWSPGRLVLAGGGLAAVVLLGVTVATSSGGASSKSSAASAPAIAPATAASGAPIPAPGAPAQGVPDADQSVTAAGSAATSSGAASSGLTPQAGKIAAPPTSTSVVGTTSDAVIIKTGNATLVVPVHGVAGAVSQLEAAAAGLGGFLQDSNVQPSTATVTLRVPAASFESLLGRLAAIGKVTNSSSSSTDATGQSVDLAARLKAAQASRDTYLTLLSRATTIGDTLSVQQRLDDLQTQIEQLQGQQKTLDAQASDATLAVSVGEPAPKPTPVPKPTPPRTGFNLAIHQAYDSFRNGLQDVVAATGGLALFVIFLLVLVPFVKVGMRFYRRSLL